MEISTYSLLRISCEPMRAESDLPNPRTEWTYDSSLTRQTWHSEFLSTALDRDLWPEATVEEHQHILAGSGPRGDRWALPNWPISWLGQAAFYSHRSTFSDGLMDCDRSNRGNCRVYQLAPTTHFCRSYRPLERSKWFLLTNRFGERPALHDTSGYDALDDNWKHLTETESKHPFRTLSKATFKSPTVGDLFRSIAVATDETSWGRSGKSFRHLYHQDISNISVSSKNWHNCHVAQTFDTKTLYNIRQIQYKLFDGILVLPISGPVASSMQFPKFRATLYLATVRIPVIGPLGWKAFSKFSMILKRIDVGVPEPDHLWMETFLLC